ncbi:MAG TPA: hypothetical protein VGS97_25040 [Actinocrinis sp.]|uniref:hypothetical protein n=1 Tax=Actinocrinis sp. TaxID=1920516 RepID=UPI002DDD3810|nr:hypothetical protein [Actinocrinis sp.]HEV2347385.1 hypothetical protein [Actinocrinis sp.]
MDAVHTAMPPHATTRPGATPVRLLVWGVTEADQNRAVSKAGQAPSRGLWDFVQTDRVSGPTCPLDLKDGKSLAADQGYHWAYVAYRADR